MTKKLHNIDELSKCNFILVNRKLVASLRYLRQFGNLTITNVENIEASRTLSHPAISVYSVIDFNILGILKYFLSSFSAGIRQRFWQQCNDDICDFKCGHYNDHI